MGSELRTPRLKLPYLDDANINQAFDLLDRAIQQIQDSGNSGPATQLNANGTILDVDAIADGEFLKRVGTTVVGATPPSGGSPGGLDTYVQYNDGGSFGGDANFTWDKVTQTLAIDAGGGNVQIANGGLQVNATLQAGTLQSATGNITTVNATDVQAETVTALVVTAIAGSEGDTQLDLQGAAGERYQVIQVQATTTDDATPHTMATIPLSPNTGYLVYCKFIGRQTAVGAGAVGDVGYTTLAVAAKRVGGGAVVADSVQGTGATLQFSEDTPPTVEGVASTNDLLIQITGGDPATTVLWNATIEIYSV